MGTLIKDSNLYANKVQPTQDVKRMNRFKLLQFVDFTKKIILRGEVHFHLSGFGNKQNWRIWVNKNLQVIKSQCIDKEKLYVTVYELRRYQAVLLLKLGRFSSYRIGKFTER